MGAVAVGDQGKARRLGRRRVAWITIAIVAIGLLGAYMAIAVFSRPLTDGLAEGADRGVAVSSFNAPLSERARVVDYADRQTVTLVEWLTNSGPVGFTVNGVEPLSPDLTGALVAVTDARAGVVLGPDICCNVDERATWAAPSFTPIYLGPNKLTPVVVHVLMNNCEYNGPGQSVWIDSIRVDYSVLAFPHVQDVPLNTPLAVQAPASWSASTCPRPSKVPPTG